MAKSRHTFTESRSFKPRNPPLPAKTAPPEPVPWHTPAPGEVAEGNEPIAEEIPDSPPAGSGSGLWMLLKRNLLFWQPATDAMQVSIFGPPAVSPGQTINMTVYVHAPDSAGSVRTLSRAFQHDAELIGMGSVSRRVQRAVELSIHLVVSNAATSKSLHTFVWRGTPHRATFELHVPWESSCGPAPGIVSIGLGNVRIGRVGFNLHILPRKG